jgi:Zn-dependent metalloprotease
MLSGTWADLPAPVGYLDQALGEPVTYSRTDPRFLGAMAYYHVDTYQSWLQDLGIEDVNASAQTIVPTPVQGYDNSFYQPGNDIIVLGAGGVDDGEDAEVFLHEYGHAVQDAQVPGWGAQEEGGAMGEGFGDFQAGNYYAKTSGGFQDACLMEWDSTSYSSDDPTCIRRMDNTKKYPKDVDGEVHDDGEIWAAFLWRVRDHLGTTADEKSDNAFRLVLNSHELLTPNAKFRDAVLALKSASNALGHSADWTPAIVAEAKVTGFPTT